MAEVSVDTEVLIVGAGPVGLFMANECARRGLRWRLVEKNSSQSTHSKALAIFPRTLEIFDMAGLVAPFLAAANRVTSVEIITRNHKLAHMPFAPEMTPYPFAAMVPQDITERIMVQELNRKNGTVEYGTTFLSAVQQDDCVEATLDVSGRQQKITASYVVGCDGAHSTVREIMELEFAGSDYPELFMLADIETDGTLPADQLQLCPSESGPLAIFPINPTRKRIIATLPEEKGDAPSLELVRRELEKRAPGGMKAESMTWSSYFHIHRRHTTQLRKGSIFIAGDAAHIHSPFGGQGMNTGLQDVWNLVWKLDMTLRGHGSEELLDSYSTERLPVIKQVLHITDIMTKIMVKPGKLVEMMREAVIPIVSRLAPFQHALVRKLSELDIAYKNSPVIEGSGERCLEDSMRGGQGVLNRFILFLGDEAATTVKEKAEQLANSLSEILEIRKTQHNGTTLVRPDGYITFSTPNSDDPEIFDSIHRILAKQAE